MSDIFISYSRNDIKFVHKIVNELEKLEYSVWWDKSLVTGASFSTEIELELKKCSCVIVVWSDSSIKSQWVTAEANHAMQNDKLLPISLGRLQLPLPFNQLHTTNFSCWKDKKIKLPVQLLTGISELIEEKYNRYVSTENNTYSKKNIRIKLIIFILVIFSILIVSKYLNISTYLLSNYYKLINNSEAQKNTDSIENNKISDYSILENKTINNDYDYKQYDICPEYLKKLKKDAVHVCNTIKVGSNNLFKFYWSQTASQNYAL